MFGASGVRLLGAISPQTVAAAGTATTGWMDLAGAPQIMSILIGGNLAAGASADVTWEQATDSAGTGAKALTGSNFDQSAIAADDARQSFSDINKRLDIANNYRYVRATVTAAVGDAPVALAVLAVGGNAAATNPSTD